MTTSNTYEAVALLFPNHPEADTELCDQSLTVESDALSALTPCELAEQGEDTYTIDGGLVTLYCVYPDDADMSPEAYLASFVARFAA